MFCPNCGAKNDTDGAQCFVCEKRLPSLDDPGARGKGSKARSTGSLSNSGEPIAALGDRLIAVLLDLVFLAALLFLGALALSRWPQIKDFFPSPLWFNVGAGVSAMAIAFLYYWLLEGAFGATLGKAIAGVQVRPIQGAGRIGFRASLLRNLFRFIDGLGFYFLGYLVALFSSQNRRIGDYAARTIVVQRNMPWGEKVTVLVLWVIAVAGFSWGAYFLCPRCVDLQVARVLKQFGASNAVSAPHIAAR